MKACGTPLEKGLARNWKIRLFVLWFCFPFACTSPDSPSFDDGACTIDPVQVTESDAGLSPNALPFKSAVTWKCDHDLAYQVSQFIITVQCGDYTQEYSKHIHYLLPHMEATTFNYDLEKNFLVPCFANCQLVVKSFNRSRVLVYAANASFTTPKTGKHPYSYDVVYTSMYSSVHTFNVWFSCIQIVFYNIMYTYWLV
jgi:hypothetical protein